MESGVESGGATGSRAGDFAGLPDSAGGGAPAGPTGAQPRIPLGPLRSHSQLEAQLWPQMEIPLGPN